MLRIGPEISLASAEQTGAKFAKTLGASSLAELRTIPAADLLAATKGEFRFLPIVDGWFLPKSGDDIFKANEQNDVSTITGWVADEGSFNDNYGKVPAKEFRQLLKQQAGEYIDEILKLYPASTEAEATESQKEFACDIRHGLNVQMGNETRDGLQN